jgi:hypothetical protein
MVLLSDFDELLGPMDAGRGMGSAGSAGVGGDAEETRRGLRGRFFVAREGGKNREPSGE